MILDRLSDITPLLSTLWLKITNKGQICSYHLWWDAVNNNHILALIVCIRPKSRLLGLRQIRSGAAQALGRVIWAGAQITSQAGTLSLYICLGIQPKFETPPPARTSKTWWHPITTKTNQIDSHRPNRTVFNDTRLTFGLFHLKSNQRQFQN